MKFPQIQPKHEYLSAILTCFRGYGDTIMSSIHVWGQYLLVLDLETDSFTFTNHENKYSVYCNKFETVFLYGYTKENEQDFYEFCKKAGTRF